VGGGALFFALYREGLLDDRKVVLSDVNKELVDTYKAIRNKVSKVIELLREHKELHCKEHYYSVRSQQPAEMGQQEARAARMIYLNKTGFNGLYRVNRKGEFNVPLGRYVNPTICDEENLRAASRALKLATIERSPFDEVLKRARRGDFVYFDPPYVPVSSTANFVGYAKDGFGQADQERLAELFGNLKRRGVHVMLSNSDTPEVERLYRDHHLLKVMARRQVNSRKDRRGPVGELVVLGYDPPEVD
jgi:DNA adenine methylase